MPTTRAQIDALIEKLEPSLRKAFQSAVDDMRNNVDLDDLATALRRGDINAAILAANIQPAALNGFLRAYELAFETAGAAEIATLKLNLIFNVRHLSGEQQLRQYGALFVQAVTDDTKAMLRTVLTASLARGQGALAAARDVRSYIGITNYDAGIALNFRRKLTTDPKALLSELSAEKGKGNYDLRDRRLDGIIRRAVMDGKPISPKDVDIIVNTYKNRKIAERAKAIARTETLSAVNTGKQEAYQQAVDSGKIAAQNVRKVWNTRMDGRERLTHAALNGDSVGLNERFRSPSGALLLHPGDRTAPASEICNCRCNATYRIDHLANVR